jgi:D-glycero-D-manno-heptose 1,7-bisphosphate phosphatase
MAADERIRGRHRAVFLDRDGTLNEEVGYVARLDELRVYPFSAEAVRRFNDAGLRTVLATNQAGVARGFVTESGLREIHRGLARTLSAAGARLDALYYCPHDGAGEGDACRCRKPRPGMFEAAARELDLDLSRSFAVGDRYRDLQPAFETGGRGVLVLTGHGEAEYAAHSAWPRQPEFVARDLLEASAWIVSHLEPRP